MTVGIVDGLIKAVVCIYDAWDGIAENAEEIERFYRHASSLLGLVKRHVENRKDLSPRTVTNLHNLRRNILIIKEKVVELSRTNFIRRLIFYPSLSRQIQRAHEDLSFLAQEFSIEQGIDNSARSLDMKAARERDRCNRDIACRTILDKSNGGSDSCGLLEVLKIPPGDMEETLIFCLNRLKEDIASNLELALLNSVMSALEARMKYATKALNSVAYRCEREGPGIPPREMWQGRVASVKAPQRRLLKEDIGPRKDLKHANFPRLDMRTDNVRVETVTHGSHLRKMSASSRSNYSTSTKLPQNKLRHPLRGHDSVRTVQSDHGAIVPSIQMTPTSGGMAQPQGSSVPRSPPASHPSALPKVNTNKLRCKRK